LRLCPRTLAARSPVRVLDQSGSRFPGAIVQPMSLPTRLTRRTEEAGDGLENAGSSNVEGRYGRRPSRRERTTSFEPYQTDFAPARGRRDHRGPRGVEDLNIVLLRGWSIGGAGDRMTEVGRRRRSRSGDRGFERGRALYRPGRNHRRDDPRRMSDARDDAEGTFRIEHLPPGGFMVCHARDSGPRLLPGEANWG
jgi:hypothetical protein